MAKIKKRGESGAAKNYITRNQALKKLQVTLAEFRRLCILKGIFPRQPRHIKRANKGSTAPTTFYYAKDIAYLMHEPVLQAFRDHKAFAKKVNRAIARREWFAAKNLDENRPQYRLDHIIKERYPTFADSLRDLDDALSMLFLFANIPSSQSIAPEITTHCARLCMEWQLYVMRTRSLRKVFLSIKGVYFQAVVHGQEITWLVPYMFAQQIPTDVDFRVMMTFLELYQTMIGFVLFKLYSEENLVYPPKLDEVKDDQGAGFGSLILTPANAEVLLKEQDGHRVDELAEAAASNALHRNDGKKLSARDVKRQIANLSRSGTSQDAEDDTIPAIDTNAIVDAQDDTDAFVPQASKSNPGDRLTTLGELQETQSVESAPMLFSRYVFYISRECPRSVIEFVLRSFGALPDNIGWDPVAGSGSQVDENDERITHHIIDRPVDNFHAKHAGRRVYVQPQWVVDSANRRTLLPTDPYQPGHALPPHLSPFVDDREVARRGGYVPDEANEAMGLETAAVEEDESDQDEEEQNSASEKEDDNTRPALQAMLEDPLDAGLLEAAELEAESVGGEDALVEVRKQYTAARKAAQKKQRAKQPALTEEAEAKDMAKTLLSNKQRKLYNRIGNSASKVDQEKQRLVAKKKQLTRNKAGK
ncbi:mRNA-binding ribosome synthesis protein nop7 [Malassezia yamatoensis]|uniref:Pescadillo homolog n=1 Tax=Malassezia yamatoensis TaxID=253288 RepID=A0AAJ6CGH7_9BASI|nr:mRNA-binding ribosome synthesis protein nop7 [Malassezia yamatoensis]